jgi:uncharacterized protein YsxB (DUF464 family)
LIAIRVAIDREGRIREVSASGHEGGSKRGEAIACAGCTMILRTAFETLAGAEAVRIAGTAPEPGSLSFVVGEYGEATAEWARGIADFTLAGLVSLERDFPGQFDIVVERNRRE